MKNLEQFRLKDYRQNYVGFSVGSDLTPLVVVDQPNQATADLIYDFQLNSLGEGKVALFFRPPPPLYYFRYGCYASDRPDWYGKLGLQAVGGVFWRIDAG
ncbi:MAG: hypothetical protein O7E53_02655 [Alphaproteobacteria bacterium]|nr:hypothetical protein [Alphaproteobacteria bacterium]